MGTSNQGLDLPPRRSTENRYRPPSWTSENPSIQKALGCSGQIEMIWKPARVGMGRDGPDKMSCLWAEMARTGCPVCGPRWPGQDVQFVGRDGPDKMSSWWAEMARTRCPVCGPRWLGQDVHFLKRFCQVSPSTNTTTGCAGCFKCLTAGINVCPGSLSLLDGFLPKSLMVLLDFLDLGSHQGHRGAREVIQNNLD